MDITGLRELLESMEIVTRRKAIIIELFPDKILSQSQLAKKTGITPSNLSKYISKLKEKDIIEIKQAQNAEGYSVNLVQLKLRTGEILNEASKLLVPSEKLPFPDPDNYKKILERLTNPAVQKYAADSIQISSRQHIIPYDSGFFPFLERHINDPKIRPVLVVLIKSAQNIVEEMNQNDKVILLEKLGSKFQTLVDKGDSGALKRETMNLLKELGAYNKPYKELKDLYLKQRHSGNNPDLFRSIILKDHRDKLMDLRVSMMDQYESATETEKQWFDQEFALLR
jgi:DNA-binding MarR family transcriptional regulator